MTPEGGVPVTPYPSRDIPIGVFRVEGVNGCKRQHDETTSNEGEAA
jgi:hypothetical protein